MSFSEERQRLECGYDEVPVIDYIHYIHTSTLDENVTDEVVSDIVYFSNKSNNKNKIKKLMKRLKYTKVRQSRLMECLYYVKKS